MFKYSTNIHNYVKLFKMYVLKYRILYRIYARDTYVYEYLLLIIYLS